MLRKVPDGTEDADLFGSGVHGYTSGDAPMAIPPTIVDHYGMNHLQEEIARAVEGSGATLDTPADVAAAEALDHNYYQLDDAIQQMGAILSPANSFARHIISGFDFTHGGASLDVTVEPGQFMWDGRRYVITSAKLADAGVGDWTLAANMDTYFFIAPEDPAAPASPPDRATVHIERAEVAVGAAAPATPAGTIRFFRLTTDGAGVTATQVYGHGPMLLAPNGRGLQVRRVFSGASSRVNVIPTANNSIDIGLLEDPELATPWQGRTIRRIGHQERMMRSSYSSFAPQAYLHEFHAYASTTGGGDTDDIIIAAPADYFNGSVVNVTAEVTAIDEDDQDGFYWAVARFGAGKESGNWNMDGSGAGAVVEEHGSQATGDGVGIAGLIDGSNNLVLRCTGRTAASHQMRWQAVIRALVMNPPADIP